MPMPYISSGVLIARNVKLLRGFILEITLKMLNTPPVIAVASAWAGVVAHLLKKNLSTVGTYKHLKRYCKRHFTTILFSSLIAFGLGVQTMAGYDPLTMSIYDLMALAFGKAYIGDSIMEVQRKREEQK